MARYVIGDAVEVHHSAVPMLLRGQTGRVRAVHVSYEIDWDTQPPPYRIMQDLRVAEAWLAAADSPAGDGGANGASWGDTPS